MPLSALESAQRPQWPRKMKAVTPKETSQMRAEEQILTPTKLGVLILNAMESGKQEKDAVQVGASEFASCFLFCWQNEMQLHSSYPQLMVGVCGLGIGGKWEASPTPKPSGKLIDNLARRRFAPTLRCDGLSGISASWGCLNRQETTRSGCDSSFLTSFRKQRGLAPQMCFGFPFVLPLKQLT